MTTKMARSTRGTTIPDDGQSSSGTKKPLNDVLTPRGYADVATSGTLGLRRFSSGCVRSASLHGPATNVGRLSAAA